MGSRWLTYVGAAAVALSAACAGPRVEVGRVAVHPAAGGQVRVEAEVRNAGGAGEVKVTVRLRERLTGRTFVASRLLDVAAHGEVDAVVDVPAPPGDYTAAVAATFPP